MPLIDTAAYNQLHEWCLSRGVNMVAVSKTHPVGAIKALYDQGQRDFGENKVQELVTKFEALPPDICWHLIGHLQTNKVKYIAPFVHLVHSVDSLSLLMELNKQAIKCSRTIDYLFQIYIAREETKFGLSENELRQILQSTSFNDLQNIRLRGLMGMATNTSNESQIHAEFAGLKKLFDNIKSGIKSQHFDTLSMGMSADYPIAVDEGGNMIRVGSLLFGQR